MPVKPIFDLPNRSEEYLEKVQARRSQETLLITTLGLIFVVAVFSFTLALLKIDIEQNFKINTLIVQFAFSAVSGIIGYFFGVKINENKKNSDISKNESSKYF